MEKFDITTRAGVRSWYEHEIVSTQLVLDQLVGLKVRRGRKLCRERIETYQNELDDERRITSMVEKARRLNLKPGCIDPVDWINSIVKAH